MKELKHVNGIDEMILNSLLKKIDEAFKNIPYPDYDYYNAVADMEYISIDEIRKSSSDKKLQEDITMDEMIPHRHFIYFLNEADKIYYFPTYMKYILTSNDELVSRDLDVTFLTVVNKMNLSILTKEQKKVILNFVTYCLNHNNNEYEYDIPLLKEVCKKL